jgi:hypothetical protein
MKMQYKKILVANVKSIFINVIFLHHIFPQIFLCLSTTNVVMKSCLLVLGGCKNEWSKVWQEITTFLPQNNDFSYGLKLTARISH